jgi:A/G-specific adenine glycosylase
LNSSEILSWFKREGISYPWGRDADPYRVWISEIMLQQTVVTAVIPFFERWMEKFPTLELLAQAGEGDILRFWEGLGYYSRARNIHKTARILYERGGEFPSVYEELIDLPGIGDYTACAVLSISFKQALPVMDANVRRICQRLACQREWNRSVEGEWKKALTLVMSKKEPGLFNCALMQMGQLVCKRSHPDCTKCPLLKECGAYKENLTEEIPPKRKRTLIDKTSQVLIFKREEDHRILYWIIQRKTGIGRGLWAFPRTAVMDQVFSSWIPSQKLAERTHFYTRYRENLLPLVYTINQGCIEETPDLPAVALIEGEGFWATAGELKNLAVPAVYRKIINELITLPE